MSIGHAVQLRAGLKDPTIVYAKLKNGSIWRFNTPISSTEDKARFAARIRDAGYKVQLKHWFKVRNSDGTSPTL